ncbi:MAG: glycosyltransferase family 2 protein [Chloroflexota bacterium]
MPGDARARVSVVVPARGRLRLLREALESIRAIDSSSVSLEILVCDNGGGDAADVAQAFDARHLLVERHGAAAARNVGIRAATGEFLAFLDSDDVWLSGNLLPQVELLQARPDLDAVIGQVVTTDVDRLPISPPWPESVPNSGDLFAWFLDVYPQIGATVTRIGVRDSVGLMDEDLLGDEDWDWHLRLALRHKIGFVPVPGVLFRQRPVGTFDQLQWMRLGFMGRVYFRAIAQGGSRRPGASQILRGFIRHRREYYDYFVGSMLAHAGQGNRGQGWRSLGCAAWSSPVHAAHGILCDATVRRALRTLLTGHPFRYAADSAADGGWPASDIPRCLTGADDLSPAAPASAASEKLHRATR